MLKDRLDLIIKELGLSGRQFEKECGLPFGGLFFNQFGVIVDIADEKSETRIKTTHIGVICVEFFQ